VAPACGAGTAERNPYLAFGEALALRRGFDSGSSETFELTLRPGRIPLAEVVLPVVDVIAVGLDVRKGTAFAKGSVEPVIFGDGFLPLSAPVALPDIVLPVVFFNVVPKGSDRWISPRAGGRRAREAEPARARAAQARRVRQPPPGRPAAQALPA
jgi:hypothetical protein